MSSAGYHHYNPDWLTDDALVANFVARMDEFAFLRQELARAPLQGNVQHYLLVGLRGSGKTTLLKRLAVAIRRDAELQDHLIALSFPEELYQVKNLADFWWVCCEALADELDHLKQNQQADQLLDNIEQAQANKPAADAGLQLLQTTCAALQRRPILLVDNLDLVFQRIGKTGRKVKDPHASAYWELREALSTAHAPMVIGGSVRLSEPFTDYDKAFYDFFMPKRLGKLSLEEVKKVLNHLAETQNAPDIKQRLQARPARIAALFELTGGNLRALGLIFELLRQGPNSRAVEDFERLMDSTTPYYKARFEDLPEQAQVVMHALAVRPLPAMRFGHTAAETAGHVGLATSSVSAQMEILIREGLVEKTAAHGRTQYRIAEQLFRLWLQMRSTRRVRQNVLGLTEFFEALFDQEEIQAQMDNADYASALSEGKFHFAIAGTHQAASLRQGLEARGADCILQHLDEQGGKLTDYFAPGDLHEALEKAIQLSEQLQQCGGGGLNAQQQAALLGSLRLSLEQKQASVKALCQKDTAQQEVARLQPLLKAERQQLLRDGLKERDLEILFRKRAQGLLPLPGLTPHDIETAKPVVSNQPEFKAMVWRLLGAREYINFANDQTAQEWLAWGLEHASTASSTEWANVAGAMRRSQRYQPAQQTLEQAFARGNASRAWHERAAFLVMTNGNLAEAEVAFRKAIELDPADALPWVGLANLLGDKLNRHDEAEVAYRKAIELNPANAWPWYGLANLLTEKLNRYDEAEAVFRKAIELDPAFAHPWNNLAILLTKKLNRHDEAEAAYRKAIELDPAFAYPWNNLANLLTEKLNRHDEAEAAYRKAIELDPTLALPMFNLGRLLDKQHRLDEASVAFDQWAALDADPHPWHKQQRANLQIRLCREAIQQAVQSMNLPALQNALTRLLDESVDVATSLVSKAFVEELLAPLLSNKPHAEAVLDAMHHAGYKKHARPMLLAFEAALHGREAMLSELEPEIQTATKRMFKRLTTHVG
ncbi:MAG: tetratricopeptide repeat protein [Gammaproteobacteria bacterium]|nr:tetratricopeptide repeat protein [Gammaproteobacteria bacterium]